MAFAFVQQVKSTPATSPAAVAYGLNNVGGNLLVAILAWTNTANFTSFADSQGNIWTQNGAEFSPGNPNIKMRMFSAPNCNAGANTVTLTISANVQMWIYITEYSGGALSNPFDATAGLGTAASGGNANLSIGPITVSQNGELIVTGGPSVSGAMTLTPGGVYNGRQTTNFAGMDNLNASAGSQSATGTWSSGVTTWAAMMGAFFPASAVYSEPDCRAVTAITPNSSRVVQGTLIYDVQKAESRTAGAPVDSRTAGAPVDSRVAGQAPQNSRTPGTFGPGLN